MANPQSQHRCVFVGNIPYDATEEQLIQICEEVGPVVSFRLVFDRETGKPKGYGFCEYKDEETALSARRNLQGYEINGRQLRVDFAENDKNNADRSRDQGRGGPGMAANTDTQKQFGGPPGQGDAGLHQPLGLPVAMAAASVMAGALGGAQSAPNYTENSLHSQQPILGSDPLTLQLAKMSRNQLNEILSAIKVMATQNKEQAKQLLLSTPQLPKAIFQAQIMLGMVSQQMLQMPNIRQGSGPLAPPLLPNGQPSQTGQLTGVQNFPGLPPLAQNKVHYGTQQSQQAQVHPGQPNSMVHNQFNAPSPFPSQPRFQNPVLLQGPLPGPSPRPPVHLQQSGNLTIGLPPVQAVSSSSMQQQAQVPTIQRPSQTGSSNLVMVQPSLPNRPPLMDHGLQPSTLMTSGPQNNPTWARRVDSGQSLLRKDNMTHENPDPNNRPTKMVKLDDGRSNNTPFLDGNSRAPTSVSASSVSSNQLPKAESAMNLDSQLPPDVESALLQQVLNLTPEQLRSLPPDQQQQVIQLQKMLRQPS